MRGTRSLQRESRVLGEPLHGVPRPPRETVRFERRIDLAVRVGGDVAARGERRGVETCRHREVRAVHLEVSPGRGESTGERPARIDRAGGRDAQRLRRRREVWRPDRHLQRIARAPERSLRLEFRIAECEAHVRNGDAVRVAGDAHGAACGLVRITAWRKVDAHVARERRFERPARDEIEVEVA